MLCILDRPVVTLAYYRGTVPKYEKHKRFSYIETVPKAATPKESMRDITQVLWEF